ncbi:MAG TPA: hypothetical protein DDY49_10500 [Paenibacillaceae bacterium]|nr:hypothetical protein [Paenibacillaceae bacterium]
MRKLVYLISALLTVTLFVQIFTPTQKIQAQTAKKIWDQPYPATIRVAVRESRPGGEPDPRGRILYVMSIPFESYIRNVLPNEWLPSWHPESLKAGAMAIKMFGWFHAYNPIEQDNQLFHVDNTVNFQVYRDGTDIPRTNAAFDEIRTLAYIEKDDDLVELFYRAGYPNQANYQYKNAQKMSQNGSHFLADKQNYNMLQILQFYYEGRKLIQIP